MAVFFGCLECPLIRSCCKGETDAAKLSAFYSERVKELSVIKRSAITNSLYGGWKLVVEDKPELTLERADS